MEQKGNHGQSKNHVHFWNYESVKNCPELNKGIPTQLRGKAAGLCQSFTQLQAAKDHNPKCLFILVGTKEDLLSEETQGRRISKSPFWMS